jgi:hypothetical protein
MNISNETIARLESYDANIGDARELFARKNTDYGDSIRFGGVLSACYNIMGAAMRLPTLMFFAADHGRSKQDKLYDIFLDLINYANIAMMMMKEDNWEGRF